MQLTRYILFNIEIKVEKELEIHEFTHKFTQIYTIADSIELNAYPNDLRMIATLVLKQVMVDFSFEGVTHSPTSITPFHSQVQIDHFINAFNTLEIIGSTKNVVLYTVLSDFKITDVLNLIFFYILNSVNESNVLVQDQLNLMLSPVTNVYCTTFDIPDLGKLGHFEFLFQTLSQLHYSNPFHVFISNW